jgi:general secretion pathway protein B
MSSILKALKKLEQEKAARKPDSFRIDAEILRGGPSRSFLSKGTYLSAIALFLCGVGATYLFMKSHEVSVAVQPAQTYSGQVKSGPSVPVVPLAEPDKSASDSLPQKTIQVKPGIERPESSGPAPRNMTAPLQLLQKKQTGGAPRTELPEPDPVPSVVPRATDRPGLPLLKVQGIAFQDGSANGVAVVNGVAVSKGSVIEGVRVEEIQNDRVTFSRDGKKFEIVLDKSN